MRTLSERQLRHLEKHPGGDLEQWLDETAQSCYVERRALEATLAVGLTLTLVAAAALVWAFCC